ncbi:hypothetical protein BDA99DRAFT_275232 [Phascolomyces articulosus]|uniref:Uncharacterized protein n=1 Tax=Phascolomyces articulosus TaxID=60185 RepID=A0AAD5KI68_9FUNG|nr:hypothetical protein BDA99DRAFT_275232 [Phascolomyces articulosus]
MMYFVAMGDSVSKKKKGYLWALKGRKRRRSLLLIYWVYWGRRGFFLLRSLWCVCVCIRNGIRKKKENDLSFGSNPWNGIYLFFLLLFLLYRGFFFLACDCIYMYTYGVQKNGSCFVTYIQTYIYISIYIRTKKQADLTCLPSLQHCQVPWVSLQVVHNPWQQQQQQQRVEYTEMRL